MNIGDQSTPVNGSSRDCNICTPEDLQSSSFSLVRRNCVFKNTILYRCILITCSKRKLKQESYTVFSTGNRGFNFFWLSGNFDTLHLVNVGPHYISCKVEFSALEAGASPLYLALGV